MTHTPETTALIDDITAIVARYGDDEHVVTDRVAARMRDFLASPVALGPGRDRAHPDHYVMYPVWVDPEGRFSIAAAVWNVGQQTPIHDHATWGVVGIVSGVERELRYTLAGGVPERIAGHDFGPGGDRVLHLGPGPAQGVVRIGGADRRAAHLRRGHREDPAARVRRGDG